MRLVIHTIAAAIVVGAVVLASVDPQRYDALMQEDRAVEWGTVVLFLVAGIVGCAVAVRTRRVFDLLVGLFCIFVAGEEISWGQRLIGYTPPAVFLEHNTQQEANVHNFAEIFGRPKWILIIALSGYGLLLPAFAHMGPTRRFLDRLGATAPTPALVPWFAAAVALLVWYPLTFTGEWVELLSSWLFVAASPLSMRAVTLAGVVALPASLVLTWLSALRQPSNESQLACARAETQALLADIVQDAGTPELDQMQSVHKRVWSSIASGYVEMDLLRQFHGVSCGGGQSSNDTTAGRRRYIVDPWGTAYWMDVKLEAEADVRHVIVYSFGPNRRRDAGAGDDVRAVGVRR